MEEDLVDLIPSFQHLYLDQRDLMELIRFQVAPSLEEEAYEFLSTLVLLFPLVELMEL